MKILDLTAGHRAIWWNKNNPLVKFLDIRPEVEPDLVCDTKDLPAAVGDGYNLVVFDPPHFNTGHANSDSKTDQRGVRFRWRYGHWTHAQIRSQIKESAKAVHKVTAENALMALKWNDRAIKLRTVLQLMDTYWEPLFGDVSKFLNGRNSTHWVMLRRRDL